MKYSVITKNTLIILLLSLPLFALAQEVLEEDILGVWVFESRTDLSPNCLYMCPSKFKLDARNDGSDNSILMLDSKESIIILDFILFDCYNGNRRLHFLCDGYPPITIRYIVKELDMNRMVLQTYDKLHEFVFIRESVNATREIETEKRVENKMFNLKGEQETGKPLGRIIIKDGKKVKR